MPSRWATEFQKGKRQHIALSTGIYWYFFLDACPNEHPIDTAVIMDESTPDEVRLEHEKTVAKVREQRARDAKTNKDALFDRMSEFYVSLFGRIVKWTDRDEFLWVCQSVVVVAEVAAVVAVLSTASMFFTTIMNFFLDTRPTPTF